MGSSGAVGPCRSRPRPRSHEAEAAYEDESETAHEDEFEIADENEVEAEAERDRVDL